MKKNFILLFFAVATFISCHNPNSSTFQSDESDTTHGHSSIQVEHQPTKHEVKSDAILDTLPRAIEPSDTLK